VEDLGFFDGIAGLLLTVLSALEGLVGNWGAAIILLTLLVRGVLFPINRRSQTAMAQHTTKMKRVQPKLNAVKEQYKDNPQKLRQEQAKIMQDEGAFPPLGGCLPMFLQIPVFFGLFSALRVSFDLRQASFLWIEDLSMPDRLLRIDFNTHLPFIGTIEYLNVLPPLMVVLWILQQRLMPKPTDEQAARMQKMMMWMPVLFGVFLYNYAGGLSLYMITSSLFGIAEYTIVRKIWPIDDAEKARKPGKFMQRMREMQEQQARVQKQQQTSKKSGGRRKKRR
jgi:YidC/Oxa1 family membrane protein insertase